MGNVIAPAPYPRHKIMSSFVRMGHVEMPHRGKYTPVVARGDDDDDDERAAPERAAVDGGAAAAMRSLALPVYLPVLIHTLGKTATTPVLPVFAREVLGLRPSLVGATLACTGLGRVLANVPAGRLAARCAASTRHPLADSRESETLPQVRRQAGRRT